MTEAGELLFTIVTFIVAIVIIGGLSAIVGYSLKANGGGEDGKA